MLGEPKERGGGGRGGSMIVTKLDVVKIFFEVPLVS